SSRLFPSLLPHLIFSIPSSLSHSLSFTRSQPRLTVSSIAQSGLTASTPREGTEAKEKNSFLRKRKKEGKGKSHMTASSTSESERKHNEVRRTSSLPHNVKSGKERDGRRRMLNSSAEKKEKE